MPPGIPQVALHKPVPRLRIPYTTNFYVRYSPSYDPPGRLQTVIDEGNPIRFPLQARYDQRPRVGLWWTTTVFIGTFPKSAVRTHVKRRLSNAFLDALRDEGYDKDGLKFRNIELGSDGRNGSSGDRIAPPRWPTPSGVDSQKSSKPHDLIGTLAICAREGALTEKYDVVKEEASKLAQYLIHFARTTSDERRGHVQLKMPGNRPKTLLKHKDNLKDLHPREGNAHTKRATIKGSIATAPPFDRQGIP